MAARLIRLLGLLNVVFLWNFFRNLEFLFYFVSVLRCQYHRFNKGYRHGYLTWHVHGVGVHG